jgi:hypothetical protein
MPCGCQRRLSAHDGGMTEADLKPEQVERLAAIVGRELRFLNRLCDRMNRLGFPPDDPLFRAAMLARNGMHGLNVAAHYANCESGVGR